MWTRQSRKSDCEQFFTHPWKSGNPEQSKERWRWYPSSRRVENKAGEREGVKDLLFPSHSGRQSRPRKGFSALSKNDNCGSQTHRVDRFGGLKREFCSFIKLFSRVGAWVTGQIENKEVLFRHFFDEEKMTLFFFLLALWEADPKTTVTSGSMLVIIFLLMIWTLN